MVSLLRLHLALIVGSQPETLSSLLEIAAIKICIIYIGVFPVLWKVLNPFEAEDLFLGLVLWSPTAENIDDEGRKTKGSRLAT